MGMTKADRLAAVHEAALAEFDDIQAAVYDVRMQCLQARRFYSIPGAQWEGDLGLQFENKPKLEVNKIHLAVIRVINEYRNNRVEVDFTPKDGDTDETADTCDGLYRADAHDSGAQEATDNAFEEAVGGGMGAWRLKTVMENEEDDEDERQRIAWEPIVDADSCVFFDLAAKRQDKRDAKRCYVLTSMPRKAYIEEYDDDPASWPKSIQDNFFDWAPLDDVYVAEHYVVESKKQAVYCFKAADGVTEESYTEDELDEEPDADDDGEPQMTLRQELAATGYTQYKSKKMRVRKVHKYIMSGGKVLEDLGYIAGKYIPIIVTYGKRWYVDGVERCMGHVQLAMDAQRIKNMQISKLAEISAQSSVEKPVLAPEQIAGHTEMWAQDNIKNWPYLLLNNIKDAEGNVIPAPLQYTRSPQIPPAMAALLQLTDTDLQDLLGNQQAGEEMQPNVSGKVVELIQNRLDMQSYIYMSNLSKAKQYEGLVWLSMANDIYVEEGRKMKSLASDNTVGSVKINGNGYDTERGMYRKNDISKAKFDVYVDVGPTSSSKRASTVRTLTGLMAITGAADPQTTQMLSHVVLMNVEGEGMQDIRDYSRQKLVRDGVIKPTEEEKQELEQEQANQQPDAQTQFLMAESQKSAQLAQKAAADTALSLANVDKTKADTQATLASIPHDQVRASLDAAQTIHNMTKPEPLSQGLPQ